MGGCIFSLVPLLLHGIHEDFVVAPHYYSLFHGRRNFLNLNTKIPNFLACYVYRKILGVKEALTKASFKQ